MAPQLVESNLEFGTVSSPQIATKNIILDSTFPDFETALGFAEYCLAHLNTQPVMSGARIYVFLHTQADHLDSLLEIHRLGGNVNT